LDLNLREKSSEMLPLERGFLWCWNCDPSEKSKEVPWKFWNVVLEKDGKISWTHHVKNEVLHIVREERNILHTIKWRNTNWIGHILGGNCLPKYIIEGKVEGTRRRGRRRKQLLDDLKGKRRYWYLREEARAHTLWRTPFGRSHGPFAKQTM
jgi:hypothetical protein